jgi:mono/diheme cytochrome c family protein
MQKFRRIMVLASLSFATVALAQNSTAPIFTRRPVSSPHGGTPLRPVITLPTLVFDSETKTYDAKAGEASAPFVFNLTNVWTNEIVMERTATSCGCTVAKLPEQPWHLKPSAHGEIKVTVNLAGKPPGLTQKEVTVFTSVGVRLLTVKVNIPFVAMTEAQRKANAEKAVKDRQSIFHRGATEDDNCAACHIDKGLGKSGPVLYAADCGICHDSPNRATGVPDLQAVTAAKDTNFDYWKEWISNGGRAGSMMPAFAKSHGGPLTDAEINNLAAYLVLSVSRHRQPASETVTNAALIKKQTP